MNISWNEFCDKVYGCFMGKCIAGTVGAPYEGYKGIMDVQYTPELFGQAQTQSETVPNDDLDLQVLWLEVIEKNGPNFTSEDLARAFYEKCPYAPGEYATFKKNYELGLRPPLTGSFNNHYYLEGMGAPIRAEIWACLAPGEPLLAAELAEKDGCLDHKGESVIAEQYVAVLEALAFTGKYDIQTLVVKALTSIDEHSRFYQMAGRVIELCSRTKDWKQILTLILRDYGHPDCTNLFQNMGIILMALLLGCGNFITTVMLALNCGFDTDCTCATVGSIIGICEGARNLHRKYKFGDYVTGVDFSSPAESFMTNITVGEGLSASLMTASGAPVPETSVVGTGMRLVITDSAGETVGSAQIVIRGDCDGDGKCGLSDLLRIRKQIVGLEKYGGAQLMGLDANADGSVGLADLLAFRKHIVGILAIRN